MAVQITDSDFQAKVLESEIPVLLDFWAPWCGPCRTIAPVLEELAAEYAGRVLIAKMNVDESPATPGRFRIRSIPTLILFKGGEAVETLVGAAGKAQLKNFLDTRALS